MNQRVDQWTLDHPVWAAVACVAVMFVVSGFIFPIGTVATAAITAVVLVPLLVWIGTRKSFNDRTVRRMAHRAERLSPER